MKVALFLAMAIAFAGGVANAAVTPLFQDIKPPTQQMIEKQSWAAPWGGYSTWVANGIAGPTSAAAITISSGFSTATVDFARNLTLQASAPDYNKVLGCTVVVNGTDYLNHSISENFVIAAGQSTATTGAKAFYTVTSVAFPASCEASPFNVLWYLGMGTKLGVKRCMVDAASMFHGAADGVKEATAPTMAANASVVSSNTASFNTALNHSRNFDLYFVQNFRCTY